MTDNPPPSAAVLTALRDLLTEAVGTVPAELFDLAATLRFTSQSKSSLYRAVAAGEFPAAVDTPSGPRWRRRDLVRWVEKLKRRN